MASFNRTLNIEIDETNGHFKFVPAFRFCCMGTASSTR